MAKLFGYALTLLPPSAINTAIVGQFSGSKQQEVLVSHGSWLELLRMDTSTRKVVPHFIQQILTFQMMTVLHYEVFGIIRSITPFRLAGSSKGSPLLLYLNMLISRLHHRRFRLRSNCDNGISPRKKYILQNSL
jgi:hypothetical protein